MLVPYKRFTIETTLSVDQAMHALSQVLQSSRSFWPNPFSDERRHFVGTLTKEGFRVVRNIYYLNSFLPEIKGIIKSSEGVTNVKITMIGNPWILISFIAVFAFFAFFLMIYLSPTVMSNLWMVLGTLVAGGLGYLTYTFAFAVNVGMDRNYLLGLFLSQQGRGQNH
jgi:hypothetical protein